MPPHDTLVSGRSEVSGARVGPPAGLAPGVPGGDSAKRWRVRRSVAVHDAKQALVLEHIKDEGMARDIARLSASLGLRQQTLTRTRTRTQP